MDTQGRLYTAERDDHRILRTNLDGSETVIANEYDGKRLNAPNDVVVRRDGQVYFSDPASAAVLEERELSFNGLYHVNPQGKVALIAKMARPNGVALTQDGRILYAADSQDKTIRAYDLDKDGNASNERILIRNIEGTPDGLRVAANGNLYIACKGVAIYTPQGDLVKDDRISRDARELGLRRSRYEDTIRNGSHIDLPADRARRRIAAILVASYPHGQLRRPTPTSYVPPPAPA